jgi:hypothetical protein
MHMQVATIRTKEIEQKLYRIMDIYTLYLYASSSLIFILTRRITMRIRCTANPNNRSLDTGIFHLDEAPIGRLSL